MSNICLGLNPQVGLTVELDCLIFFMCQTVGINDCKTWNFVLAWNLDQQWDKCLHNERHIKLGGADFLIVCREAKGTIAILLLPFHGLIRNQIIPRIYQIWCPYGMLTYMQLHNKAHRTTKIIIITGHALLCNKKHVNIHRHGWQTIWALQIQHFKLTTGFNKSYTIRFDGMPSWKLALSTYASFCKRAISSSCTKTANNQQIQMGIETLRVILYNLCSF